jgi:hypothetical protein
MKDDKNTSQPLAEVFGFPIWNDSAQATRYRNQKLCPFNNNVRLSTAATKQIR